MDTILLNLKEAAEELRIGRSLLFRLIGEGKLRTIKLHKRRLVPKQAVEELVGSELVSQDQQDNLAACSPPRAADEEPTRTRLTN